MSLNAIPGQDRAKRFLRHLFKTGKLPHALLFSGMSGIGKERLAWACAKGVNCQDPPWESTEDIACGRCSSCRKIDREVHPDVVRVEKEGASIKIRQIKEIKERCRVRPFEGRRRVILIRDAQDMTEEAANALLKILEEPPPHNLFILLVLEPQMLLPTILSRCCHIRCQPLDDRLVRDFLVRELGLDSSKAQRIARISFGSMERARAWAERDGWNRCRRVLRRFFELIEKPMIDFFDETARWAKESEDLEQDLECIKFWVRNQLIQSLGIPSETVFDESAGRDAFSRFDRDKLILCQDVVERAIQHLRSHANKQMVIEGVCLKIKDMVDGKGHRYSFPGGGEDLPL